MIMIIITHFCMMTTLSDKKPPSLCAIDVTLTYTFEQFLLYSFFINFLPRKYTYSKTSSMLLNILKNYHCLIELELCLCKSWKFIHINIYLKLALVRDDQGWQKIIEWCCFCQVSILNSSIHIKSLLIINTCWLFCSWSKHRYSCYQW